MARQRECWHGYSFSPFLIFGLLLMRLLAADGYCVVQRTSGYNFKRIPDEFFKTINETVRELQFSVTAPSSVHIRLVEDRALPEAAVAYEVDIDYINHMNIERTVLEFPNRFSNNRVSRELNVLSDREQRAFWLRYNKRSRSITFGPVGKEEPYLSLNGLDLLASGNHVYFMVASLKNTNMEAQWIFCTDWAYAESLENMTAGLNCRQVLKTSRYNFSDVFPAEKELVQYNSSMEKTSIASSDDWLFHFAIQARHSAHIKFFLQGDDEIEVDLEYAGSTNIEYNGERVATTHVKALNQSILQPMWIRKVNTMFEIGVGGDNTAALVWDMNEFADWRERAGRNLSMTPSRIGFASMSSGGPVVWLHGCKEVGKIEEPSGNQSASALDNEIRKSMEQMYEDVFQATGTSRNFSSADELVEDVQRSCRVVQTLRAGYDQFFDLREGASINGSRSTLAITAWGSKFRVLLSEDFPVGDKSYEILLGVNNATSISHQGDNAAAYVETPFTWKTDALEQFIIEHDAATGEINIFHKLDPILTWRDPNPFPIRYFSVASGTTLRYHFSSNTTWIFGCTRKERTGTCRDPVHANKYMMSQYFWMSREATLSEQMRTLKIWIKAKNSAHLRFEPVIPNSPSTPPMAEFDFGVEDRLNLDIAGRRVATHIVQNAVNEHTYTGYWIRQRLGAGSLEVGKIGENTVLLRYIAVAARIPELRFFSMTNSQRAGNSSWVYGCSDTETPGVGPTLEPGEDYDDYDQIMGGGFFNMSIDSFTHPPTTTPAPRETKPPDSVIPISPVSVTENIATLTTWLTGLDVKARSINFDCTFRAYRVTLDEKNREGSFVGHMELKWSYPEAVWQPSEKLPPQIWLSPPTWLKSQIFAFEGEAVFGSDEIHMVRYYNGSAVWSAVPVTIKAFCDFDVTNWPREHTLCSFVLGMWSPPLELTKLATFVFKIESGAMRPGWVMSWDVTETTAMSPTGTDGLAAHQARISLQHKGDHLHTLYITPLIVAALFILIPGWMSNSFGPQIMSSLGGKLILHGCGLLILAAFAMAINGKIPANEPTMPRLLQAYSWCMGISALYMALSALLSSKLAHVYAPPPSWLVQLFSAKPCRYALCLTNARIMGAGKEDVQFNSGSDQVYVRHWTNAEPFSSSCDNQDPSAFWSWQLITTGLSRVLSTLCFVVIITIVFTMQ